MRDFDEAAGTEANGGGGGGDDEDEDEDVVDVGGGALNATCPISGRNVSGEAPGPARPGCERLRRPAAGGRARAAAVGAGAGRAWALTDLELVAASTPLLQPLPLHPHKPQIYDLEDPVEDQVGYVYERSAIEQHIRIHAHGCCDAPFPGERGDQGQEGRPGVGGGAAVRPRITSFQAWGGGSQTAVEEADEPVQLLSPAVLTPAIPSSHSRARIARSQPLQASATASPSPG
jgi:hypothetical protein